RALHSFPTRRSSDLYGFIKIAGGTDKVNTATLKRSVAGFPDTKVRTHSQFKDDQTKWISQLSAVFYVLLGLAVIISLFGIVNTRSEEHTSELQSLAY